MLTFTVACGRQPSYESKVQAKKERREKREKESAKAFWDPLTTVEVERKVRDPAELVVQ